MLSISIEIILYIVPKKMTSEVKILIVEDEKNSSSCFKMAQRAFLFRGYRQRWHGRKKTEQQYFL